MSKVRELRSTWVYEDTMPDGVLLQVTGDKKFVEHFAAKDARMQRLEDALRPFAREAEGRNDDERDDEPVLDIPFQGSTTITLGDCRRARAVLKEKNDD